MTLQLFHVNLKCADGAKKAKKRKEKEPTNQTVRGNEL